MRTISKFVALLAITAAPTAAMAGSVGSWKISGTISGRSFVLDCRLDQPGGVCIDATNRSRSHPLTSLAVNGAAAQWAFSTKVAIMKIAMHFNGRIEGNRMNGEVTAAGRKGTFTGVRS